MTGVVALHHEIVGEGPDLVLLHGGAGSIEDLPGLRDCLVPRHRVIAPDQRRHGRSPAGDELTYAAMAGDTAALLDSLGVRAADFVGWSDGGVVALLVALQRPDLVRRIVPVCANVDWEPAAGPPMTEEARAWLANASLADMPMPDVYGESAAGPDSWPETVASLFEMWRTPPGISLEDLGRIQAPALFLTADRDIVTLEHTIEMYRAVPEAQLGVIPATTHRLPQEEPAIVADLIERFLGAA